MHKMLTISCLAATGARFSLAGAQTDQQRELFGFDDGDLTGLTDVNSEIMAGVARAEVLKLGCASADGTPVEAFFVRPTFKQDRLERWLAWFDHYLESPDQAAGGCQAGA
jgi:hypothetical protein